VIKIEISHESIRKMMSKSDRYVVYQMLGAVINFKDGKNVIKGKVDEVLRDIFEDEIVLRIGTEQYIFPEPQLMLREGSNVVFVYGDLEGVEIDDEELFKETRMSGFSGETMDEVLKRTAKGKLSELRFDILEEPIPVQDDSCDSKDKKVKKKAKKAKKRKKKGSK